MSLIRSVVDGLIAIGINRLGYKATSHQKKPSDYGLYKKFVSVKVA